MDLLQGTRAAKADRGDGRDDGEDAIFAAKPRAYACFYGPNQPYSRAQLRDCAAGHVEADGTISECGIIEIVGPCEKHCQPFKGQGDYYPSCTGAMGVTSSAVLTTFLL